MLKPLLSTLQGSALAHAGFMTQLQQESCDSVCALVFIAGVFSLCIGFYCRSVQLFSCKSKSPDEPIKPLALGSSPLVCNLIESVYELGKLKMSPEFVRFLCNTTIDTARVKPTLCCSYIHTYLPKVCTCMYIHCSLFYWHSDKQVLNVRLCHMTLSQSCLTEMRCL